MGTGQLSVYPHLCIEITAFKVKKIPLFFFLFQGQFSFIPDSGMFLLAANTAFFGLIGKRHQDLFPLGKIFLPSVFETFLFIVKGKIPLPV